MMRYAQIRSMDISNGEGIGIALFVQGCYFHCYNCFNPDTWDFHGGKEWTQKTEDKFIELANKPYIKRISILGGEPLAEENLDDVAHLIHRINETFNNLQYIDYIDNNNHQKAIWLYTGYTWEELFNGGVYTSKEHSGLKRRNIIKQCHVLVDGRYIDSQKDITLKWRGSSNQRVINVKQTINQQKIILYTN